MDAAKVSGRFELAHEVAKISVFHFFCLNFA